MNYKSQQEMAGLRDLFGSIDTSDNDTIDTDIQLEADTSNQRKNKKTSKMSKRQKSNEAVRVRETDAMYRESCKAPVRRYMAQNRVPEKMPKVVKTKDFGEELEVVSVKKVAKVKGQGKRKVFVIRKKDT